MNVPPPPLAPPPLIPPPAAAATDDEPADDVLPPSEPLLDDNDDVVMNKPQQSRFGNQYAKIPDMTQEPRDDDDSNPYGDVRSAINAAAANVDHARLSVVLPEQHARTAADVAAPKPAMAKRQRSLTAGSAEEVQKMFYNQTVFLQQQHQQNEQNRFEQQQQQQRQHQPSSQQQPPRSPTSIAAAAVVQRPQMSATPANNVRDRSATTT